MLALSRCPTVLSWRLSLRCSALPLGSATMSSQPSTAARPQFLRTQTAQFHQSKAKASPVPDPNKPSSGKNTLTAYIAVPYYNPNFKRVVETVLQP